MDKQQEKIQVAKELMKVFTQLRDLGVLSEREFETKRNDLIGAFGHVFAKPTSTVVVQPSTPKKAPVIVSDPEPAKLKPTVEPIEQKTTRTETNPPRKDVIASPNENTLDQLLLDLEIPVPSQETKSPVQSENPKKPLQKNDSTITDLTNQRSSSRLLELMPKKKIKFKPIKQLVSLSGHEKNIFCLTMSGNTFFSGGKDSTIKAWNISTAKQSKSWQAHEDAVYSLSKTKQFLISGSWDKRIKLWDLSNYEEKAVLSGHTNYVSSLCPVGETILYSGGFDSTIQRWDLETQKVTGTMLPETAITGKYTNGHTKAITQLLFSDDKKTLFSGSQDGSLKLWNDNTDCIHTYQVHNDWIYQIAMKGDQVFTASRDGTIKIVDIRVGEVLETLEGHQGYVMSLAMSGNLLFSGSFDGSIKVWNLTNFECTQTIEKAHTQAIYQLLAVGNTLFSGSWDSSIKVWQ